MSPFSDSDSDPTLGVDDELLAVIAAGIPVRAPSPSLRERVLSAGTAMRLVFLDRHQGIWLPHPDSAVAIKELFCDSRDRATTRLLRVARNEALPAAALQGTRTLLVISGRLWGDAGVAETGDCVDEPGVGSSWQAADDALVLDFSTVETNAAPARVQTANGATWVPYGDGIRVRPLSPPSNERRQLHLLSAEPNATLIEHEHAGVEELYVLQGSCTVEGRNMRLGDYHRAASGSSHDVTRTGADGCVLLCSVRALAAEPGA